MVSPRTDSRTSEAALDDDGFALDLLRSMRCGLLIGDEHQTIRFINQQARQILDLDDEVALGTPLALALAHHPHLAHLLREAPRLNTLPDRAEAAIRTRDGRDRTIGYTLSRVRTESGAPRGAALFFKDLTPIEHREAQARLAQRLAELGAMAASLAHEIRNPLASLDLSTTLLRRRLPPEGKEAKLATTLQEQIRRLSTTVNRALEYVRPLDLKTTSVNLAHMVDLAIQDAAAGENGEGKTRVVRRFPDEAVTIQADAARLREAFVNLVRNAVEAMASAGGVLEISIQTTPSDCRVRFADSGPGISGDLVDKIFAPFFSTKPKGSGLGLAWCRKVVDAHGGILDVVSTDGEGAAFCIRLPRTVATPIAVPTGDTLHEAQDSCCRG
ncbi:MAG: nitrogen regulation protein NR(II) [Acidobacteriota bacterium]